MNAERERVYLTPDVQEQIARVVHGGGTIADAIRVLNLNPSTVYRWLQRAREGVGTRAMARLIEAVRAAEASRGMPVVTFRTREREDRAGELAALTRRVRILETCVAELAGIDVADLAGGDR